MRNSIRSEMDERVLRAMSSLLSNSDFRLVIGHIFYLAGIENSTMNENASQMCYLEGRRSIGLDIARFFDAIKLHGDSLAGYEARQEILADYKRIELDILHDMKEGGLRNG